MSKSRLTQAELNLIAAFESIFPKKSQGGQLLSTGAGMIPGYGQILGPLIGMMDSVVTANKEADSLSANTPKKLTTNANIYGAFQQGGPIKSNPSVPVIQGASPLIILRPSPSLDGSRKSKTKDRFREKAEGGLINEGFKQYNTGSHNSGQDQSVDLNGNPNNNNPVASIQNRENSFKVGGQPYVMSDTIVNPETGNLINMDAMKLNSKHKTAHFIPEEKNSLNFGMERLSKINDAMKMVQESVEKAYGGSIKKMYNGGDEPFVPTRIDPFTGRESNLISDAPLDLSPDALATNVPSVQSPFNPTINTDSLAGNFITDGEPLATDNTIQVNAPEIGSKSRSSSDSPITPITSSNPNPAESGDPNWANKVAIGLKAVALGKSISDAMTPAEKEQPILPNYYKSDRYMQSANIDYTQAKQDAMGASNIAANVNRSGASNNFAAFQGREQARVASLQDSLSRISEAENNATSQLNLTKGQYEQNKAVDTANRLGQNRIDNFQNQANKEFASEKLFTELSQIGSSFNKYNNFQQELANNKELQQYYIKEGTMILNNKYTNFGLSEEFLNDIKSGKSMDELIKFYPNDVQKFVEIVDKTKQKG